MQTPVPVLFLVFNRPHTTRKVFAAIRKARPRRLYIAADGPRDDHPSDLTRCKETRAVAEQVDWPCEVHKLYREKNLGCRRAVSSAIDWFFENEESGIIMEDDCLADDTWFPFAQEMLERYKDDDQIMCVSATHFPGSAHQPPTSYYFSIYNHCWGWATWRDAWEQYDFGMACWPKQRKTSWLLNLGQGNWAFKRYWTQIFDQIYNRKIDSWAYYWTYSVWSVHGLTVMPGRNLVINLGLGTDATHPQGEHQLLAEMELESMKFPLEHPTCTSTDDQADHWTTINHFEISLPRQIKNELSAIPYVGAALISMGRFVKKLIAK